MPKFSIVIPIKNGKPYLQQCIESILSQTYTDYNIIILADRTSNSDGTIDWLRTLQLPNLIIEESNEEFGIQKNWARILKLDKSEFFTILGYDDILYANYLETIAMLINNYPEATLYQTQFDFIDSVGNKTASSTFVGNEFDGAQYLESMLASRFYIMATGFIMRSKDYEKVGGIPAHYPNLLFADYELWLRLTLLNKQVVSPEKCFAFRIHQSTTKLSSEHLMLQGFSVLVEYLKSLSDNVQMAKIIKEKGSYFLKYNCNYLAYRLIRKKSKYRQRMKVSDILEAFNGFATKLNIRDLRLLKVKTIRLAYFIDSNSFLRNGYLYFKLVVKKPVVTPIYN